MKYILSVLLMMFGVNGVNAACGSYSGVLFVDDGLTHPLTNVLVEGYRIKANSHFIYIYAESVDYVGGSFTCKEIRYLNSAPDSDDDIKRDELLRLLKLSMTLGYRLTLSETYSNGGLVGINGLRETAIIKP